MHPKGLRQYPTYQCEEGQRLTSEPHILFFNDKFQPEGAYQLVLKSPYKHFCNAMLAMGVADKARNELLVTVQCFDVDRAVANKRTSVGATWKRSTVLFRVKAAEGKLLLEQDDSCLGNPNDIESIPEARKRLKKCSASSK